MIRLSDGLNPVVSTSKQKKSLSCVIAVKSCFKKLNLEDIL